jgi:hypothetical protein
VKETQIAACKVSTSISSLIGNATGYARYFLESKFPPGFFKKTHIGGALAEVNMEQEDIQKFPKPTLFIIPEYTGENGFMELIPYWHTAQYFTYKNPRKKYNGVLYDNVNDIYLYSIPDRIRLNFNVRIKLPTQMYAYNLMHYLKQKFEVGGYFYLNDVKLNTEVPKMYAHYIADRLGYDLATPDGREKMDEYFLNHSYNGITEKINMSSGNSQFSYGYNTNILVNFPDTPSYERNENGLVTDSTVVSFSFSFEFWAHSNYIMEIKGNTPEINMGEDELMNNGTMKYDFYVPTTFIKEQIDNKHLIVHKPFLPDINTEVDILDFSPIINSDIKEVVREALKNKIDMSKLLQVKVLVDNQEILPEQFAVNWENFNLITQEPMYNVTYTLMIYGNLKSLNLIDKCISEGQREKISTLEL